MRQEELVPVFAKARQLGVKTVLDVALPGTGEYLSRLEQLLPHVDVFLPNTDEAAVITGLKDPLVQAQKFRDAGCGAAVCGPLWVDFGSGAQASILSSPTAANGVIYAGRNTAEVLAWRARPCGKPVCNQIWKGLTGDSIVSSSPAVVNGTVYVGSADALFPEDSQGRIYVFDLGSARG